MGHALVGRASSDCEWGTRFRSLNQSEGVRFALQEGFDIGVGKALLDVSATRDITEFVACSDNPLVGAEPRAGHRVMQSITERNMRETQDERKACAYAICFLVVEIIWLDQFEVGYGEEQGAQDAGAKRFEYCPNVDRKKLHPAKGTRSLQRTAGGRHHRHATSKELIRDAGACGERALHGRLVHRIVDEQTFDTLKHRWYPHCNQPLQSFILKSGNTEGEALLAPS
ncbi:hypothetical protein DFH09DRAFT_1285673 [Mycena vulgaris]|nr:hypothetical protein DFH09DRAFT_1285673 [Mycena vulgaris]